mmetsp:Transcript_9179/g.12743  ORF Transcript_9179/g.12743 Transcript_9179/m.12743 type:complete len:179 (+) Transcript_9179:128-664(+)
MLVLILEIIVESFLWELGYNNGHWWYYFLFLSYWSLLIQALYLLFAVIITWKSSIGTKYDAYGPMEIFTTPRRGRKSLHSFVMTSWVLQNISATMSLATTQMFWTAYPNATFQPSGGSFKVHGWNFIISAIDIFMSCSDVRIMHFYQPILFGALYASMSYSHNQSNIGNGTREGQITL